LTQEIILHILKKNLNLLIIKPFNFCKHIWKETHLKMYDFVVVGAGFFGAVFAHEARKAGKKVLVIEKRDHIGGNCYSYTER
jgi:NADPH-dependent 2,4-dienoyl-CoA reductase/sulfur reductase-like enzyme